MITTTSSFQYFIPELLSQVFVECLPDNRDEPLSLTPYLNTTSVQLGQVCSHWRGIALSTPSLWSSLEISGGEIFGHVGHLNGLDSRYAAAVSVYMTRSRNLPVSISFKWPSFLHWNGTFVEAHSLSEQLLLHVHRWKSLRLEIPRRQVYLLTSALEHGVPLLEDLDVRVNSDVWLHLDFGRAPQITKFKLLNAGYAFKPLRTPLTSIRSLQLPCEFSCNILLRFLRDCPMLEDLTVDINKHQTINVGDMGDSLLVGTSELHHLTTFRIVCMGYHIHSQFVMLLELIFDHLLAPAMKSLSMTLCSTSDPNEASELRLASRIIHFLQRSSPPLEFLFIKATCIPLKGLLDILEVVPSIHHLDLSYEQVTDGLVKGLMIQPSEPLLKGDGLCPNLRRMQLLIYNDMNKDAFVEMISSRCGIQMNGPGVVGGPPEEMSPDFIRLEEIEIKSVAIVALPPLEDHPIILHCIAQGLKLVVQY